MPQFFVTDMDVQQFPPFPDLQQISFSEINPDAETENIYIWVTLDIFHVHVS
jgi:hypothetical protein